MMFPSKIGAKQVLGIEKELSRGVSELLAPFRPLVVLLHLVTQLLEVLMDGFHAQPERAHHDSKCISVTSF